MTAQSKAGAIIGAALAVCASATSARADDAVAAQALFDEGKKAMAAHDYANACPKLDASLKLEFALGTLLNLADCNEHLGKVATAWAQFLELAGKAKAAGQGERFRLGKQRAAALAPKLPKLVIRLDATTPGEEVKRDGTVVAESELGLAIPLDPGPHTIEAGAAGRRAWSKTVTIGDAPVQTTVAVPVLETLPPAVAAAPEAPAPPAPPAPHETTLALTVAADGDRRPSNTNKVLAFVGLGGAVVAAGVGTYFGLTSLGDHNRGSNLCPDTHCPTSAEGDQGLKAWSDARTNGDRATVAFAVAGGFLGAAVVLWLTAPSGHTPPAQVGLGLDGIRVRGAF